MPSVSEIVRNFQHEAFPVPFPLLVRAYTSVFGTSDPALRAFGFVVGLALVSAVWVTAKVIGRGPPLIALALLGLNATVLCWGSTVRGYGLGATFVVLTFGAFVALLIRPSTSRLIFAMLASLVAVQCLVHNLAIVAAFTVSAGFVSLVRHDLKGLVLFLGILALCSISFFPYLDAYSSSWSEIVEFPVTARLLWNQFTFALGNPNPAMAWFWRIAFVVLLIMAARQLSFSRHDRSSAEWNLVLFALLSAIVAPLFYYVFLQTLSYLTRSWYFIALIAAVAISLDCLAAVLCNATWARIGRLSFATIAFAILPFNAWPKVTERQTNIDILAKTVTESAKPADLIVVAPWLYGISFNRYYHGPTPWITLPTITDLRIHRYDLFREKMFSSHPIEDVLQKVSETLASGNRVWFVGGIKRPPEGRPPLMLPTPANGSVGWDNVDYSESWLEQLGTFVREHSGHGETVSIPISAGVNQFENVPLVVVDGWQ